MICVGIVSSTNYIYTVQPGDTLYLIARRFSSNVQAIAQANDLFPPVTEPGLIYPGQVLVVPNVSTMPAYAIYVVAPGDTLYLIAQHFSTDVNTIASMNGYIPDPSVIYPGNPLLVPAMIYEVEPSDTLYDIATRFRVPMAAIVRANRNRPGFSPDVIRPGFRLIIPGPA